MRRIYVFLNNLRYRGKKRRGLAYKETSKEDNGFLIQEDKRWRLAPTAMAARAPEDEVQEVTIEMREEKTPPSGTPDKSLVEIIYLLSI